MAVLKLSSKVGMTIIKHTLIGGAEGGQSPYIQTPPFFFLFFSFLSLGPKSYGSTKKKKSVLKIFCSWSEVSNRESCVLLSKKIGGGKIFGFCHSLGLGGWFIYLFIIFFSGFGNSSTIHLTWLDSRSHPHASRVIWNFFLFFSLMNYHRWGRQKGQ